MSLMLFAHPFSSYCQKALIALYENATTFEYRHLGDDPTAAPELKALWPLGKFPLLLDAGKPIMEASIIVEYLDVHHPGRTRLVPSDAAQALEVRFMDRCFDNYVMTPMQKVVLDVLRETTLRDLHGVAEARQQLQTAYAWLEGVMSGRTWAAGEHFSLADCAAAPALFFADWVEPIGAQFPRLRAYRTRLLARPSFARAVDEARPYRNYFPLGAPDRD